VHQVYRDPIGVLTACVGETNYVVVPGDIKMGAKFTDAQCTAALQRSMWRHAKPVIDCTAPAQLTVGQKIAFLDFAFNVGAANFCGSTMARKARAGDVEGSCAEFARWRFAGGIDCASAQGRRTCGGVWTRRQLEDRLCSGERP
jgi:lysozyme